MIMQNAQVLGHIGLLHTAGLHELADRQWPALQRVEQRQAAGLGKDPEQPRHRLELGQGDSWSLCL